MHRLKCEGGTFQAMSWRRRFGNLIKNSKQAKAVGSTRKNSTFQKWKKKCLLGIIVERASAGLRIITVYRTSKIDKYWNAGNHK